MSTTCVLSGVAGTDGLGGVEQEGGACGRAGTEASQDQLTAAGRPHHRRPLRALAAPQGSGVLLREPELPQGVPEDSHIALQR